MAAEMLDELTELLELFEASMGPQLIGCGDRHHLCSIGLRER